MSHAKWTLPVLAMLAMTAVPAQADPIDAIPVYSYRYTGQWSSPLFLFAYCDFLSNEIVDVYEKYEYLQLGYYDNQGEWNDEGPPVESTYQYFDRTGQTCTILE